MSRSTSTRARRGWSELTQAGAANATRLERLRSAWRRAAARDESPWVMAVALLAAGLIAYLLLRWLPHTGSDVEKARQLGIVSQTVIQGYSKSADVRAFFLGLAVAVAASTGLWLLWAGRTSGAPRRGRGVSAPGPSMVRAVAAPADEQPAPRWHWLEWVLIPLLIVLGFFKLDMARNGFSAWASLAEEGEMMAWVDTLLRGGVLSRDVYCLYGPLSTYPVAFLFKLFGPSLLVWRMWIFALNLPALLAVYVLLRGLTRTRGSAVAGMFLVGLLCTSLVPAMSWSLSRVAIGLGAVAALDAYVRSSRRVWLLVTGALVGLALFYSQEVGVSAAVAVTIALLIGQWQARAPLGRQAREFGFLAAGGALVVVPMLVLLVRQGALGATIENLFIFPRVRMLGYAAYAFPPFDEGLRRLSSGPGPADWEVIRAVARAYFAPAVLVVSAFLVATRILRGEATRRLPAFMALLVFGGLVFQSPLSRPDGPHLLFALPPVLVLLVCFLEQAGLVAVARASSLSRRSAAMAFIALWLVALGAYRETLLVSLRDYVNQAGLTLTGRFSVQFVPGFRTLALPRAGGIRAPEAWARDLEDTIHYLQARTRPGEPVWAFPNEVLVNFLADRPLSNPYPLGVWGITRQQREETVAVLRRTRPAYAVFYLDGMNVDNIPHQVAMPEPFAYLDSEYILDRQFGRWLVLRRQDVPA